MSFQRALNIPILICYFPHILQDLVLLLRTVPLSAVVFGGFASTAKRPTDPSH